MTFEFVQAIESDKEYLLELRKLTMTKHLQKAGQFLSEEDHLERLNHRYECSYLVLVKSQRIGFVKYFSTTRELELIQIQVEPKHQGKGYGQGIIQKILDIGKGKTVKLSVLKDNPAVELYRRLGFQTVGDDRYEYHMQNKQ